MTSHEVLQTIDINSRDVDRSPARKRPRYVSPAKEKWNLTRNSIALDEIYDCGVGLLESESEDENGLINETTKDFSDHNESLKVTSQKDSSKKMSLGRVLYTPQKVEEDYFIATDTNYFDRLSDEVILYIFHFLPKRFLNNISFVCRRWYCLTQDESLWSRMDISNKNLQPGAIGHILSRQVVILRLAQSHIVSPAIISGCRASLEDFKARLLYLDLSLAHISHNSLVELFSKCNRLKKLSLEHVPVNEEVMKVLSKNKDLEVLNLSMADGLEIKGLTHLLSACDKLRELNLAWTCLSTESIDYVCANLPESLDRLNISGCRKLITNQNVLDIVSCCENLRELDLSDSTGLSGEAVHHITLLNELNFLALSRCYMIPYTALLALKKIESLLYLDVHGGYIDSTELAVIQNALGSRVNINKFKFSSVARPTVGSKRSSIWNLRVRD